MDKWAQKKKIVKEIFLFLLKFNLLLIPFYAIIYFDLNFYPLQEVFARFIASILSFLGYRPEVDKFLIYVGGLAIDISRDCLGWKSIYSLVALILASPGKLKSKLKFIGLWVPYLLFFNIFRVLSAILVGLKFGSYYLELLHKVVWEEVVILMIVGIWYLWMKKAKKLNKEKQ